jgi:hypothetical protein
VPYRSTSRRGQASCRHGKEVSPRNGRRQRIFSFAGAATAGEALDALPAGREIVEHPRTGLPFVKGTGAAPAAGGPGPRPATRGTGTASGTRRPRARR